MHQPTTKYKELKKSRLRLLGNEWPSFAFSENFSFQASAKWRISGNGELGLKPGTIESCAWICLQSAYAGLALQLAALAKSGHAAEPPPGKGKAELCVRPATAKAVFRNRNISLARKAQPDQVHFSGSCLLPQRHAQRTSRCSRSSRTQ